MPRLSPARYAALTTAVTWAVGVIIVTGGAVRLTGSGLGCPDWPTCTQDRLVAAWDYHQMVEFVTGTIVTGSGPHGGDTRAQRFPFLPTDVARVHSIMVMLFLGLTLLNLTLLRRAGAPEVSLRRATFLLGAIVAQAAVGYTQYLT